MQEFAIVALIGLVTVGVVLFVAAPILYVFDRWRHRVRNDGGDIPPQINSMSAWASRTSGKDLGTVLQYLSVHPTKALMLHEAQSRSFQASRGPVLLLVVTFIVILLLVDYKFLGNRAMNFVLDLASAMAQRAADMLHK